MKILHYPRNGVQLGTFRIRLVWPLAVSAQQAMLAQTRRYLAHLFPVLWVHTAPEMQVCVWSVQLGIFVRIRTDLVSYVERGSFAPLGLPRRAYALLDVHAQMLRRHP